MKSTYCTAVLVALASSAGVVSGATVINNFSGSSPGDYGTAGNWSQGRVPGSSSTDVDKAVIGGGASVSLSDDFSANASMLQDLTLNDGATLHVFSDGNVTSTQSKWDHGWLNLGSSGSGHVVMHDGTLDFKVAMLNNSSTITLNGGTLRTWERAMEVGRSAGGTATITLAGGDFLHGNAMTLGSNGGTGIINQTAGDFVAMTTTQIGGLNSTGIWNLSGGEGWMGVPSIGASSGSTGAIHISGTGVLNLSREINLGTHGDGSIIVSGQGKLTGNSTTPIGEMQYTRGIDSFDIGTGDGTGLLKVIGNQAIVEIKSTRTGGPHTLLNLGANGILGFAIDDSTVSAVQIVHPKGSVILSGTIDLELIGGYSPTPGSVYDLITGAQTITDDGFALSTAAAANWSLSILGIAGQGQTLQAIYVPEPAAMSLVALAGAVLFRRRR